jgi:hypothetical protein
MLACLLLAACRWSQAEVLTVYRCVAADGRVALQDRPCPAGSAQERARHRRPAPVAAPAADAAEPVRPPAPAAPPTAAPPPTAPPAPPPLWECVRHDGSRYASDTGIPERRWVPLWVLGRDPRAPPTLFGSPGTPPPDPPASAPGAPAAPPGAAALGPGAWVSDRCLRLTAADACSRYRERRDALRHRWHLAMPSERDRIRPQERALSAMLRERCGS